MSGLSNGQLVDENFGRPPYPPVIDSPNVGYVPVDAEYPFGSAQSQQPYPSASVQYRYTPGFQVQNQDFDVPLQPRSNSGPPMVGRQYQPLKSNSYCQPTAVYQNISMTGNFSGRPGHLGNQSQQQQRFPAMHYSAAQFSGADGQMVPEPWSQAVGGCYQTPFPTQDDVLRNFGVYGLLTAADYRNPLTESSCAGNRGFGKAPGQTQRVKQGTSKQRRDRAGNDQKINDAKVPQTRKMRAKSNTSPPLLPTRITSVHPTPKFSDQVACATRQRGGEASGSRTNRNSSPLGEAEFGSPPIGFYTSSRRRFGQRSEDFALFGPIPHPPNDSKDPAMLLEMQGLRLPNTPCLSNDNSEPNTRPEMQLPVIPRAQFDSFVNRLAKAVADVFQTWKEDPEAGGAEAGIAVTETAATETTAAAQTAIADVESSNQADLDTLLGAIDHEFDYFEYLESDTLTF